MFGAVDIITSKLQRRQRIVDEFSDIMYQIFGKKLGVIFKGFFGLNQAKSDFGYLPPDEISTNVLRSKARLLSPYGKSRTN